MHINHILIIVYLMTMCPQVAFSPNKQGLEFADYHLQKETPYSKGAQLAWALE